MPDPNPQTYESLLAQAAAAARAANWPVSVALYRKVLGPLPENLTALLGAAHGLRKEGNAREARIFLGWANAYHPDAPELRRELGWLEIAEEHYDVALPLFQSLLDEGEADPAVWTGTLLCLRFLKKTADFDRSIDAARKACPTHRRVLTECALLLFDLGRFAEGVETLLQSGNRMELLQRIQAAAPAAMGLLEAASLRLPDDRQLLHEVGQAYMNLGQDESAVRIFEEIRKLDPSDRDAVLNQVVCLRRLRRVPQARSIAEAWLIADPDDPGMRRQLAEILWNSQETPAEDQLAEVLRVVRSPGEVLTLIRASASTESARQLLASAILRWPKDASLPLEKARVELAMSSFVDAEATFRQVRSDHADDPAAAEAALLGLLDLLRRTNRPADAALEVKSALALAPRNVNLLDRAAGAALDLGRLDEAARLWIRAESSRDAPNSGQGPPSTRRRYAKLRAEAVALCGKGRFRQAVLLLKGALSFDEQSVELSLALGNAYSECGRYRQALRAYTAAVQLLPQTVAGPRYGIPEHKDKQYLLSEDQTRSIRLSEIRMLRYLRRHQQTRQKLQAAFDLYGRDAEELLFEEAWLLYGRRSYEQALDAFDRLHQRPLSRNRPLAAEGKALCLRRCKGREEALAFVNGLLPQTTGEVPAVESRRLFLLRGSFLSEQGRLKEALQAFRQARKLNEPDGLARECTVLGLLHRGDEARKLLKESLIPRAHADAESTAGQPFLLSQFVWLHLQGNTPRAAQHYVDRMPLFEGRATRLNSQGSVHFANGRYHDAERYFRRVWQTEKQEAYANCNLARALVLQVNEIPMAVVDPESGALRSLLRRRSKAALSSEARSLKRAEKLCRRALAIDPTYANAHGCLGVIAFKRNELTEAEAHFRRSIRESLPDAEYTSLGALYLRTGRPEKALPCFRKAARLDRNDAQPRIEIGKMYLRNGETSKALDAFREARSVAPKDETAVRELALALMKAGQLGEAKQELQQALASLDAEKHWQIHLTLARVLAEIAERTQDSDLYTEALRQINKAMALRSDVVDVHFYAGVVCYKQQNWDLARKHFRACGDHFDAKQNLRKIKIVLRGKKGNAAAQLSGILIASFCFLALVSMWYFFLTQTDKRIESVMIMTLSPILLGVIIVGLLLPFLDKFKLGGVEAELSRPTEQLTGGTPDSIDFGGIGGISARAR